MCRPNSNSSSNDGLRLGFIGFGTIAYAIAQGIAAQQEVPIKSISVSRRSVRYSTSYAKENPGLVTIHDDPKEIVDASPDLVFICVLPAMVHDVLQQISFPQAKTRPTLVSLVAGKSIQELSTSLPGVDVARIVKMICTPSIAQHEGISLLLRESQVTTKDDKLSKLLSAMGGFQDCRDEQEMSVLMTGACVMGPVYALMQAHIEWMEDQNVPTEVAHTVVTKQYAGIIQDTLEKHNAKESKEDTRVKQLIAEQTPNGINEQAKDNLTKLGGVSSYRRVLDLMLHRLEGRESK